jgi:hypothetical protein
MRPEIRQRSETRQRPEARLTIDRPRRSGKDLTPVPERNRAVGVAPVAGVAAHASGEVGPVGSWTKRVELGMVRP